MARNFYCSTFFGQIFNRNNLTFLKARILRNEYFNRSRFCFLDFTITSNLEKILLRIYSCLKIHFNFLNKQFFFKNGLSSFAHVCLVFIHLRDVT
jgi:hypothetical protein